jgi:hypothetical protein
MDKYDVYEILYRGFVLVAISGGMLYFVMRLSELCNGFAGMIISIVMYFLWAIVTIGTASYVLIIMKGTFRPKEPEPDTIDDLIEELEDIETEIPRLNEIITAIRCSGIITDGGINQELKLRLENAVKKATERINGNGDIKND